jgi:hypothetical protein
MSRFLAVAAALWVVAGSQSVGAQQTMDCFAQPEGTPCGAHAACDNNFNCLCVSGYKDCGAIHCVPNGTCCANGDCAGPTSGPGSGVCSGMGGSCSISCSLGYRVCGTACIVNNSCCVDQDCGTPANGTAKCTGSGGTCTITCSNGYKTCGNACIPTAQCCVDGDCPSDPAGHRQGVCSAGSCSYACAAGYKACGVTCILTSNCCTKSDCVSPPNGCYMTQGTCSGGACSYGYNDGAACNADNDACTPNDKCQSGACFADTANIVKCIRRECHSAPVCNKTTGNCDDSALADGTGCGNDACNSATGTCTSGTCSVPPKDCSALDNVCRVGICDPTQPVGAACATANKMNGLACTVADKCQTSTTCSGGQCIGTSKTCTPSAPCSIAVCNPATGDCEESQAPVGAACQAQNDCTQDGTCDATGACVGNPLPDGSPCDKVGCSISAACVSGACACSDLASSDAGVGPAPKPGGHGCSMSPHAQPVLTVPFALLLVWLASRRRRLAARRRH